MDFFFWVTTKLDYFFFFFFFFGGGGGHFFVLGSFFMVKAQNGNDFWNDAKISNIFFSVCLIFFGILQ